MNLYGRLSVSLAEEADDKLESFAEVINQVINPPAPVAADDLQVRAIYLVSDQVNSYGGRFPRDELQNLCELIIDSPVLVGHDKSELPIARNFKAEVLSEENRSWIKVWFYWLRNVAGSEALRANIDGGIYKEGSIGFIFSHPECSICGGDIRNCSHTPLKKYTCGTEEQTCHYNYRGIEKVLETSLVFRGATPDTHITNELFRSGSKDQQNSTAAAIDPVRIYLDDALVLKDQGQSYAAPLFFGLPVEGDYEGGDFSLSTQGRQLRIASQSGLADDLKKLAGFNIKFLGQLFKMRGKLRLPLYLWKDNIRTEKLAGRYCLQINQILNTDGSSQCSELLAKIKGTVGSLAAVSFRTYRKLDEKTNDEWRGCQSRWGCEIVTISDDKQSRRHIRNCHYLLMQVREIMKTRGGRYQYRLSFDGEEASKYYSTYETKISAVTGETLLVRVLEFGPELKLSGLIVEDNLGGYYPADSREALQISSKRDSEYTLHKVREAGLLHLKHEGLDLLVLFPQFKMASLEDNKSLIGYPLSGQMKSRQFDLSYRQTLPVERGSVKRSSKSGRGFKLELEGKSFKGKYRISPAQWSEKELLLLSKESQQEHKAIVTQRQY